MVSILCVVAAYHRALATHALFHYGVSCFLSLFPACPIAGLFSMGKAEGLTSPCDLHSQFGGEFDLKKQNGGEVFKTEQIQAHV